MATTESLSIKYCTDLYEEICAVAHHLNERNGRIEWHDNDSWLEAERIVRTLRKIAGDDGKRYILINVPDYYRKSKVNKSFQSNELQQFSEMKNEG